MGKFDRRVAAATILLIVNGPGPCAVKADDIQVNTYTTGDQAQVSLAADAHGGFLVVWTSFGSSGTDLSGTSIQGQRYASAGHAVGGQFQVNSYTTETQARGAVAMDAVGNFVVVWGSFGSSGTDSDLGSIQGQRYASDGGAVGGQFQVNRYTTDGQSRASVASTATGDFVVVWQSDGSNGTDSSGTSIQGQRYASDGGAVGGQFQVNTYTTDGQTEPSVASTADGDFVVVWTSFGSAGSDSDGPSIQGQRFASDGSAVGVEFQINSDTIGRQMDPSVAMSSAGDFVVAWDVYIQAYSYRIYAVRGQRYASDGSPTGGEFQVAGPPSYYPQDPAVAVDAMGDFIVAWDDCFYNHGAIWSRRFAADGSSVGVELQVNTYNTNGQCRSSVAPGPDGNFIVSWTSEGSDGTDSDARSIQMTLFGRIFADGFETGDTSAWAATVVP